MLALLAPQFVKALFKLLEIEHYIKSDRLECFVSKGDEALSCDRGVVKFHPFCFDKRVVIIEAYSPAGATKQPRRRAIWLEKCQDSNHTEFRVIVLYEDGSTWLFSRNQVDITEELVSMHYIHPVKFARPVLELQSLANMVAPRSVVRNGIKLFYYHHLSLIRNYYQDRSYTNIWPCVKLIFAEGKVGGYPDWKEKERKEDAIYYASKGLIIPTVEMQVGELQALTLIELAGALYSSVDVYCAEDRVKIELKLQ